MVLFKRNKHPLRRDGEQRKIMHNFTTWTSSHGIPHIGRARNKYMIIFWSIVTVIALGLLIWQVVELIRRFLRYDVAVGMELKFEQRPFPAVTVCDLNPMKYSNIKDQAPVNDLLEAYKLALKRTDCNSTSCISDAGMNDLKKYGFQKVKDSAALQSKAKNLLALASAKIDQKLIRTNQSEFIRSCSFNAKDCEASDFNSTIDSKAGNCFTFNYLKDAKYKAKRAGPIYGLRMILLSKTSEYLPLTDAAGVRVVVHDQREHPFPDILGYNVETGTATGMGVTFREIHRLGSPYGDCIKEDKRPGHYLYTGEGKNYSTEACQRSCFQRKIEEECKCSDPSYPKANANLEYCDIDTDEERTCWQKESQGSDDDDEEKQECHCPQPCQEGVYDVTVSAAKFPAKSLTKVADCREGDFKDEETKKDIKCHDYYRDNSAMVEVFYEKLNFQRLDESPAYEFVNLASDFGGQVGLWLGLSVISLVEFFVLIGLLCRSGCKKDATVPADAGTPRVVPPSPAHADVYGNM